MAIVAHEVPSLARDRAFETLYRRYVKDVYHYALALLRNPADAEDVTQTTFMNAYRAIKRGEEPMKPQNWLIKIAHNAARSRYAAASRRVKEVPLEDHLEQLALPEEARPDIEAILNALGRLPLNQRAALVLRELEGRTYAEIADTLAVSVPAVETLIFRARRSLRLKASAVRALGIVPLPSSLAQLLESGSGIAVGGSAVVGSSFLLKALVAIVAGGALTGLIRETNGSGATAAASASAMPRAQVITAKPAPTLTLQSRVFAHAGRRISLPRPVDPASRPDGVARATGGQVGASSPAVASVQPPPAPQSRTVGPAPETPAPVTTAVSTVVAAAGPALPVSPPQIPTTPMVSLPPPPSPSLPSLPKLP